MLLAEYDCKRRIGARAHEQQQTGDERPFADCMLCVKTVARV